MAGYVWNGTPEPPKQAPERKPRKVPPAGQYCGTRTGFAIHKASGKDPCQPCREAENKYSREYRLKVHHGILSPATPFNPDACGTMRGYRRHLRHRITACQPCKDANAVFSLKWKETRRRKRAADRAAKQQ